MSNYKAIEMQRVLIRSQKKEGDRSWNTVRGGECNEVRLGVWARTRTSRTVPAIARNLCFVLGEKGTTEGFKQGRSMI